MASYKVTLKMEKIKKDNQNSITYEMVMPERKMLKLLGLWEFLRTK